MTKMHMDYSSLPENNFEVLPENDYEMAIDHIEEHATKTGAESMRIVLTVRNDLDKVPELKNTNAKYHNRIVFVDNWKRKNTGDYDLERMPLPMKAAGFPDGKDWDFPEDFIKYLYHKPVLVHVSVKDNEYNGKTTKVNRVALWDFKPTKYSELQHKWKKSEEQSDQATSNNSSDPFANDGKSIDISDDDLPF